MCMILSNYTHTTLQVYYYLPDYTSIIQEFVWQYDDSLPEFPRTHKFLNYWHHNIDAVIADIQLAYIDKGGKNTYRNAKKYMRY